MKQRFMIEEWDELKSYYLVHVFKGKESFYMVFTDYLEAREFVDGDSSLGVEIYRYSYHDLCMELEDCMYCREGGQVSD